GSIGMVVGMLIPAVLSTAAGLAAPQVSETDKKMVESNPELEGLCGKWRTTMWTIGRRTLSLQPQRR
ncbi:MAG: hypothetical protein PUC55_03675, partial [Lachnospiraceae bacterium]|nr:hypothetical protein [Lachnospiraceae bacterium]